MPSALPPSKARHSTAAASCWDAVAAFKGTTSPAGPGPAESKLGRTLTASAKATAALGKPARSARDSCSAARARCCFVIEARRAQASMLLENAQSRLDVGGRQASINLASQPNAQTAECGRTFKTTGTSWYGSRATMLMKASSCSVSTQQ